MECTVYFEETERAVVRKRVHEVMHTELGVMGENLFFNPAYKGGHWDGITDFYNFEEDKFPTGLLTQVTGILEKLQRTTTFQFEVVEDRPDPFMLPEELPDELSLHGDNGTMLTLRDYQYNSVKSIIENYTGIINVATNGGKTEIASSVIDQLRPKLMKGERVAFFTNNSSIFNQSQERISKRLGQPVGLYGGGKKDIKQVTCVMIPTLNAALKNPEEGVKLTAKERLIKKIAKEIVPIYTKGVNQRKLLGMYVKTKFPSTQVEQNMLNELDDMLARCGTDNEVKMRLNGYEVEYQKIIQKKNKKAFDKYNDAIKFLESIAVMVVDEAHHSKSDTWYKSLLMCKNAQYRVALTGSIDQKDKILWQRMQALFGEITARTSNKTLIDLGHSAKPTIKIFKIVSPNLEGYTAYFTDKETGEKKKKKNVYLDIYKLGITENDYRNAVITQLTERWASKNKSVLISVSHIEHGEKLSEILEGMGVNYAFIHGELDIDYREQQLQNMRDRKIDVLIATSIVDEGIDISGIDALILGAGGKSLRQTLQRVGRVLREKKVGENICEVFDFNDLTHKYLADHSKQRRAIYKEEEFDIEDIG